MFSGSLLSPSMPLPLSSLLRKAIAAVAYTGSDA
jgi:hypothetical protein